MEPFLNSLPDDYTSVTISDFYRRTPSKQIINKIKDLLYQIYSPFDRETLVKIIVSFGTYNSAYDKNFLINEYCEKRNVELEGCDLIVKKIKFPDMIWDLYGKEILEQHHMYTNEQLLNVVIGLYPLPKHPYALIEFYAMIYNDIYMQKIQSQAYDANHKNLIFVYKEIYNKKQIMLYDRKKKFVSSDGTYIFKYAKTPPDERNELLHELFIGLMVTNNFPGFAKIYSGQIFVDCPSRIENMWKCSYIVGENIGGEDLASWIKRDTNTSRDIFRMYKTIINNLYAAYQAAHFTHYDLHSGNVIVTPDSQPYIIDFGLSFAKIEGVNIGKILASGEVYNRPMWQHDAFKLLFHMYEILELTEKQWELLNIVAEYYRSAIPCNNDAEYREKLIIIFDNIKYFFPNLELQLVDGEYDYRYDHFMRYYSEIYDIAINNHVALIFNKLLFVFTKEIGCKFYDGTVDPDYTIIPDANIYREEYNQFGAPVGEMLEMTYPFSKFVELVDSIDY